MHFFHWEILSLETLISPFLICKVACISIFYFRVFLHFSQFLLYMAYLKEVELRHAKTFSPWCLVLFLCSQNPQKAPGNYTFAQRKKIHDLLVHLGISEGSDLKATLRPRTG